MDRRGQHAPTDQVLMNCSAFDGTGEGSVGDQAIWLRSDGTVAQVGDRQAVLDAAGATPQPVNVVDLAGGYVAPGLVNMHVHLGLALPGAMTAASDRTDPAARALQMAGSARRALHAGITTARLVGETGYTDFTLRRAIRAGTVPGPRLFTAGHALCCTGGHGHDSDGLEADGADGFRRATREQLRAGADLIKVCVSGGLAGEHEAIETPQLTDDELSAVVTVAHDWGRSVTAHAGPADVIERVIELGVDGIEHGYQLTPEVATEMARRGTWYVPTITVSRCREFFEEHQVPAWMMERALGAGPRHWESLQHAIAAGVRIVMGSDMPPDAPFEGTTATVREMEYMAEAGMPPSDVLRAATSRAAEWLGASGQVGTLEPGAAGDLIVLDADPVVDVSALRTLHAVVQGGRAVRDDRGHWTREESR
ncbi:metal-dependent hydrolase family protein [Ornithinimicrobium murale]|uniref:metal-dependent hydrolase family protein n=1 Tax=Ornithinimicrobium murale TaxID=1050153 RepID=UPI001EDCF48E|nr:amidohydrolase family protein [Ornithinimicrobium murale]